MRQARKCILSEKQDINISKKLKDICKNTNKKIEMKRRLGSKYHFENRGKGFKYACIILAGYKEFLWKNVFERIRRFCPDDVDVCVVSSGVYSKELSKICKNNNWSYLSTVRNQLCIAQNIAFSLFHKAKYIYKIDEDIFITKEFFMDMRRTYQHVFNNGRYDVGFVSSLIPINAFGYIELLEKTGMREEFETNFGKCYYGGSKRSNFQYDKSIPLYFWRNEKLNDIDKLSALLAHEESDYMVCGVRYNIGAIFFRKSLWSDMGMFSVPLNGAGLGIDESDLCSYCIRQSQAMIISKNSSVAHFVYGAQMSDELISFYKENELKFSL